MVARKLKIAKEQIPKVYVEFCIVQGGTQVALAEQLGISKMRLGNILHEEEIKKEVSRLSEMVYRSNPKLMDTRTEMGGFYGRFKHLLDLAFSENNESMILKLSKPVLEILKAKGMLEKAGIVQNFIQIENMTQEQLQIAIKPYISELGKIILEYVSPERRNECAKAIDDYLENIGAKKEKSITIQKEVTTGEVIGTPDSDSMQRPKEEL